MDQQDSLYDRLKFMKIDASAQSSLQGVKSILMRELPVALDGFYAQVQGHPETRRFFTDPARVGSAKSRQIGHWDAISSGRFDETYVRAVTAVGETHARIGLEPRWYIGGYALLLNDLIGAVVAERWPRGGFGAKKGPGADTVAAELGALAKATLLDVDFSISVYLEAAEAARKHAEAEVMGQERASVVRSVGAGMAALAAGDLTYRMPDDLAPEYRQLRQDFNLALGRIEETISTVATTTGGIGVSAEEMAKASDDLSRRTEQQAAGLEETAAALDEITATVKTTAEGARLASVTVADAKSEAQRSGEVVGRAIRAMGQIEDSSRQIGQIIGVIDEIAFQTNLLALNAGVEAARAGEAGRGFAVVASEVRALAQRSAEAAREIKALISESSKQVSEGVNLVGETGQALQSIVGKVAEIDSIITAISASANEQAVGLAQVNIAVNQMDQVVQQNAAMVEESTAASHALKGETADLVRLVGTFQTSGIRPPQTGSAVSTASVVPQGQAQIRMLRPAGSARLGSTASANQPWAEF